MTADLRYGTRLAAGLSHSTVIASMDFETYSEAGYVWNEAAGKWAALPHASQGKKGISVVGAARYAEHPSTEVLCLAYDLKDGLGIRQWLPGQPPPIDLFLHTARGGLVEAWNVGFERWIWEKVCVARMGWPPIPEACWRCAMAKARAHNLPGALEHAANVLGTTARKNADGRRLLNLFSVPRNPTKNDPRRRIRPEEHPDGEKLYAYNREDVAAEDEIAALVPDLDSDELAWWQTDQRINHRGIAIDVEAVAACTRIVEAGLARYDAELYAVTGGAVEAASQVQRLTAWLHTQGVHLDSLDEDHVEAALAPWRKAPPPPHLRAAARALEIRATVGSAAVKKLFAMGLLTANDGRVHDMFSYHGARTGRTISTGVQVTNLKAGGPDVARCGCGRHFGRSKPACPWCGSDLIRVSPVEWSHEVVEDALQVLRTGSLDLVEMFFDAAFPVIAGCLRGMFTAGPGHDLICSDYSAIEAVVLAELAGEEWRREVFRTHGKIYEMSASKISGVPLETILEHKQKTGQHSPLRKIGKVAELAGGYQGWIGAWKAFGADEFMDDEAIKQAILAWRAASPAIVEFWGGQVRRPGDVVLLGHDQEGFPITRVVSWHTPELFGIEGAAVAAVTWPGSVHAVRGITFQMRADVLYCTLLSGRPLSYHRPRLRPSERRQGEMSLSYEGWNSNPKNGAMGWQRMDTWGGRLVENITQATARDIQRHALVAQDRAGYPIVQHVYDENCAEVPENTGSIEAFEAIQATLPAWCADWPVRAAGGWRGKRYRK